MSIRVENPDRAALDTAAKQLAYFRRLSEELPKTSCVMPYVEREKARWLREHNRLIEGNMR